MINHTRRTVTLSAIAMASCLTDVRAQASDFPNRPLRIVIPFATGGPTDTMTRILAGKLGEELKQQVVPENRPGAGGNIGAETVARSAPNGYTLLLGTNGPLAANKSLFGKLGYDPVADFDPVTLFVYQPNLLAVHPDVPAQNVRQLIDWLKANPGKTYASGGLGTSTHFAGELFKFMTGVEIQHVPYKGDGQSVPDVVAGNVPVIFCSVQAGMKWTESGRLRALGVTSAARVPVVRDIPPIAEAGLPGYDLTSWYAVVVPAGTPKDIIATLNSALQRAMADAELKTKIEAMGGILAPGTPEQLRKHIQEETVRWSRLVQQANVKL